MSEIDVGPGVPNRDSYKAYGSTYVAMDNPANNTGFLDTMMLYFQDDPSADASDVKCGTFYGSGTDYTPRDYELIGTVTRGAARTFTGLNCDVSSSDFIGTYFSNAFGTARIEADSSGYSGVYRKSGDQFDAGTQTYTLDSGYAVSLYATGLTPVGYTMNTIPAMVMMN